MVLNIKHGLVSKNAFKKFWRLAIHDWRLAIDSNKLRLKTQWKCSGDWRVMTGDWRLTKKKFKIKKTMKKFWRLTIHDWRLAIGGWRFNLNLKNEQKYIFRAEVPFWHESPITNHQQNKSWLKSRGWVATRLNTAISRRQYLILLRWKGTKVSVFENGQFSQHLFEN